MDVRLLPEGDRLEVTTPEDRRFTFPIAELQARRRAPRPGDLDRASDLPTSNPLWALEQARRAAEEFAILNDLM
jgi:hypothetical protein